MSTLATHHTIGAHAGTLLVESDADRHDFVAGVVLPFGARLQAYVLMDTHAHVQLEGSGMADELAAAMKPYGERFEARNGKPLVLRGSVTVAEKESLIEVARSINYVHLNPATTKPPLVADALDYPWASARTYAGLALAPFPEVPGSGSCSADTRGG